MTVVYFLRILIIFKPTTSFPCRLIHQYFLGGQGLPPYAMESLQRESADIKILTSALKQYLRALPEPLLTFELYPAFVAAVRLDSKPLQVQMLLSSLSFCQRQNFLSLTMIQPPVVSLSAA